MRTSLFVALLLLGCGPSSPGGSDGGDGGSSECDGPALSPAELVHNPGFECGGAAPAEWGAIYGTLDFPSGSAHSGQRHARVTAGADGKARFAYNPDVADDAGTATFCARAWMKGTAPYMRMRLLTVASGGGGVNNDFNSPVTADWSRVPPTLNLDAPNMNASRLLLLFETQSTRPDGMNSTAGQTLEIDDVDVWRSTSGRCDER